MPKRFVSVEKESTFQGRTERWSNVYCYEMPTVTVAAHEAIQDAVLAAERPVHGPNVTFKRTRVFTTEGLNTGDDGIMYSIMERNAAGTGTNSGSGSMYKEAACLVKWPLPRKTLPLGGLGRQRSLKKWIHPCSILAFTALEATGEQALTTTAKAPFVTYAAAVRTPTGGSLVSPADGAEPSDTAIVHPYLEHRQFPRGRKEGLL
jgi:hypothetical protein